MHSGFQTRRQRNPPSLTSLGVYLAGSGYQILLADGRMQPSECEKEMPIGCRRLPMPSFYAAKPRCSRFTAPSCGTVAFAHLQRSMGFYIASDVSQLFSGGDP